MQLNNNLRIGKIKPKLPELLVFLFKEKALRLDRFDPPSASKNKKLLNEDNVF